MKRSLPTSHLFLLFLLLLTAPALSQDDKYWVRFTDKSHTPYSIQNPGEFLSSEAIERRREHGIPIDTMDLPVDPDYRDSILAHPSVEFLHSSRWFNAITVKCTDSLHMDTIDALPFVASKRQVRSLYIPHEHHPRKLAFEKGARKQNQSSWHGSMDPGAARTQLSMMGLDHLLESGHQGQEINIAVLDAGFRKVNGMEAFSGIFEEDRYIGGFDAVGSDRYPFHASGHGRAVLSILAAEKEGKLLGAAPKANYILCRTENVSYEYRVEEHNWIAAAEFADSAGADILSTSLGYSTFDDTTQDHTPSDLDGNSTMITRGADIAASRGMLVVNSAGNSAKTSWGTLGAPADGDSVLAVGSVDSTRQWSSFSSEGPTADGRMKPDLAAMGEGTAFLGSDGKVYRGNGTSFSAPLISGAAASLWSAYPDLHPMELFKLLKEYGHRAQTPNNKLGHGVPNVYEAYLEEEGREMAEGGKARILSYSPNPFQDRLELHLYSGDSDELRISWYDPLGRRIRSIEHPIDPEHHHRIVLNAPSGQAGSKLYFLEIRWNKGPSRTIELLRTRDP